MAFSYSIPKPSSPFLNPQTGTVNRDWYLFLVSLFTSSGSGGSEFGVDDVEYSALLNADTIPSLANITGKVREIEEFIAAFESNKIPKVKTTSVTYPPFSLIQLWTQGPSGIPDGWQLSDGSGGTPNLTDLFVVGGGDLYPYGSFGGSTLITANNLAQHTHGYDKVTENFVSVASGSGATVIGTLTHVDTQSDMNIVAPLPSLPYVQPYYAIAYITNTKEFSMITSVSLEN